MKAVLDEPLKHDGFGEYKLTAESLDDLWHLSHLISQGDTVYAVTLRTVDAPSDKIRADKLEKRPVRIGVSVEKAEFTPAANRLRVFGVITFGLDIGHHHTLNVETGYEISVVRRWSHVDLERIERAVSASTHGVVHIISIEDGDAEIYRVRQYGPEKIASFTLGSGKTAGLDSRPALFTAVLDAVDKVTGNLVVAGPGFVKEDFLQFVKNKNADTARKMLLADTRRSGFGAVQEAIGNGVLTKLAEDMQLSREVSFMDEIFMRIGQNGAVAYGTEEVQTAVDFGAVETFLVVDSVIRDAHMARLIEEVETAGAKVVVLSSGFEPGERLAGLGGVAALLRFKVDY